MTRNQFHASSANTDFMDWWQLLAESCVALRITDPGFGFARGAYEDGSTVGAVLKHLEGEYA